MTGVGDATQRLGLDLGEEQLLIREAAASFARERLAPGAAERDRTERFPAGEFPELAEMGLLAMTVPEEWGGTGTDYVGYVLAMEAIAEACASTAVILASSNLASKVLADHASEAQKDRWLRPFAEGRLGPASLAWSESDTGSFVGALRTTATRDGDHWVLEGSKTWVTAGAQAGIHLVFAKTAPEAGAESIGCFVVDKDTPGLTVGPPEERMGLRSAGMVELRFEACRVPEEHVVGAVDGGTRIALSALGVGRIGVAAQSIGIAEAAIREGLAYAHERRAFGQRVTEFQNTQLVLADSRTELDAAWLLALRAARLLDRGDLARTESSMAKVAASEAAGRVADRMLQLHGGYGYSREYAIERLYRDARVMRAHHGTNETQRLLIARDLVENLG